MGFAGRALLMMRGDRNAPTRQRRRSADGPARERCGV